MTRWWRRRLRSDSVTIIVSVLITVGVASYVTKTLVLSGYTWKNGVTDIGGEALPAAILYLLLDRLVAKREEERRDRETAIAEVAAGAPAASIVQRLVKGGTLVLGAQRNARLEGMALSGHTFSASSLRNCNLDGAQFVDTKFCNVRFLGCFIRLASFERCDFNRTVFEEASSLTGAIFSACTFDAADSIADDGELADLRFVRCAFAGPESRLPGATYTDCTWAAS